MTNLEIIEKTREELDHHKSLPLLKRIGRRAMGHYPSIEDREALKRHEMGPFGRIAEDTISALRWTKKLNRTPAAVFDGKWQVAQQSGTVLMDIESDSDNAKFVTDLFSDQRPVAHIGNIPKEELCVGLFVPDSSPMLAAVSIMPRGVGVYVESSLHGVATKTFLPEEIEGLPEKTQQGFEHLALSINRYTSRLYARHKPETLP